MSEDNIFVKAKINHDDSHNGDYLVLDIPIDSLYGARPMLHIHDTPPEIHETTLLYHIHKDHDDYEATKNAVSGPKQQK